LYLKCCAKKISKRVNTETILVYMKSDQPRRFMFLIILRADLKICLGVFAYRANLRCFFSNHNMAAVGTLPDLVVVPAVYMTFWPAHKAIRYIALHCGGPKCGGEKPHKGRRPTAVFRSPIRFSGEAYTVLLCAVPHITTFFYTLCPIT
jgi:hypothetical protein